MFDFFLAASVLFFKYMRAVYVCSKAMTQVSCSPAVRETVLGPLGPALPLQSWGVIKEEKWKRRENSLSSRSCQDSSVGEG